MTTRTITLSAEHWQRISETLEDCHDEGPKGEGWQSAELSAAAAALDAALAQPEPACVACDGAPAPENSPCSVCGAVWAQPVPDGVTDEELDDEMAKLIPWLLEEAMQAANSDAPYAAGQLTLAAQLLGERQPALTPIPCDLPVPTDEELLSLDELRDAWNAQADAVNSWDELGMDEIIWFAQQQALARWGRPALTPNPCDPSWRSKRSYSVAVETTYGAPPANPDDAPTVCETSLGHEPSEHGGRQSVTSSGAIRVEGTFEYCGRTYRYETDAHPITDTP